MWHSFLHYWDEVGFFVSFVLIWKHFINLFDFWDSLIYLRVTSNWSCSKKFLVSLILYPENIEITGLSVLPGLCNAGIEPRASSIWGKHSVNCVTSPELFAWRRQLIV